MCCPNILKFSTLLKDTKNFRLGQNSAPCCGTIFQVGSLNLFQVQCFLFFLPLPTRVGLTGMPNFYIDCLQKGKSFLKTKSRDGPISTYLLTPKLQDTDVPPKVIRARKKLHPGRRMDPRHPDDGGRHLAHQSPQDAQVRPLHHACIACEEA